MELTIKIMIINITWW